MNGLIKTALFTLCATPFLLTGTTFVLEASRDLGADIRARGLTKLYAAAASLPPLERAYIAASIDPCLNAPGSFVKGTEHEVFFKAEMVHWRPMPVVERERLAQRLMQRCLKAYVLSAHDHDELYHRQQQVDATGFALSELRTASNPLDDTTASPASEDINAAISAPVSMRPPRFNSDQYAAAPNDRTPFSQLIVTKGFLHRSN